MSMLGRTLGVNSQTPCFYIPTGCLELDRLLKGGIASQSATEVFGASGCGKTVFAIELMLNTLFSEVDGNVFYISSKCCLTPGIIREKIKRLVTLTCEGKEDNKLLVQKYLNRIHYKRTTNLYDLIFAVHQAVQTVERSFYRNPIKLVIIDSLTYYLRNQRPFDRTRISYELLTVLEHMARKFNCAVLITTDMSANVNPRKGQSSLKSMLNDYFAIRSSKRIELNKNPHNNHVCAIIRKFGHARVGGMAFYRVDEKKGIIDLVINNNNEKKCDELNLN